eukprot:1763295-Lingulodinium_polyedra.AAC.1
MFRPERAPIWPGTCSMPSVTWPRWPRSSQRCRLTSASRAATDDVFGAALASQVGSIYHEQESESSEVDLVG